MVEPLPASHLALVLSGGGARSAHQAGVLAGLAERLPDLAPTIFTGVSAGAINVAYLAAHRGSFAEATAGLVELWRELTIERVFRADASSLAGYFWRWGRRLVAGGRGSRRVAGRRVRALLDTEPLWSFLRGHLPDDGRGGIAGIRQNIAAGKLHAVGVTSLEYGTGRTITWVQGREATPWQRGQRGAQPTRLAVAHVMASAALPILFPAIHLAGGWHGDGGIRLTAPMSPALKLGAEKILALSTRHRKSPEERVDSAIHGYPPPAQIAGQLLSAVFLDLFDQDADRLARINALCRACPDGAESLGFRVIETEVVRPSEDLGRLAAHHEARLPRPFRFATRGLGTRETKSPDFLSLLLFQPDYIEELIQVGRRDAETFAPTIATLIRPSR